MLGYHNAHDILSHYHTWIHPLKTQLRNHEIILTQDYIIVRNSKRGCLGPGTVCSKHSVLVKKKNTQRKEYSPPSYCRFQKQTVINIEKCRKYSPVSVKTTASIKEQWEIHRYIETEKCWERNKSRSLVGKKPKVEVRRREKQGETDGGMKWVRIKKRNEVVILT